MSVLTLKTNTEMSVEMADLKSRLKLTWESGDYTHFATYLLPGALEFLSRIAVEPGTRILDVACGAGQTAIPMARAGAKVTGIDLATNLVDEARLRAEMEYLDATFDQGDAENLPYDDASFDMTISLIGAMFAPRPDLVAAELKRVTKPGGKIIMGNWTPTGFVGQMFKVISMHVPPSPLMVSPVKWGDLETVRERFANGISNLHISRRLYPFKYPFSPEETVEFFRKYYGPAFKAFATLDDAKQQALRKDLEDLWNSFNTAKDGTTSILSEYLEVIAVRA